MALHPPAVAEEGFFGVVGSSLGSRASRPSSPESAAVVHEREVGESAAVVGECSGLHARAEAKARRSSFPAVISVYRLFAGIQGVPPFFSLERRDHPRT
jgi:hypothetical protein